MKSLLVLFALGALALTFTQCNDAEEVINPSKETVKSIQEYFAENDVESEKVTFQASVGHTFTTKYGSNVTIPANAFTKPNGDPITGEVEFTMKEVYKAKDMMFSGVVPVSNGNVLNSGGQFFMDAQADGEKLNVAEGKFVNLVIPAQGVADNMELFLAQGGEDADSINWVVPDSVQNDTFQGGRGNFNGSFSFSSADGTYNIEMDSMGWGNIDAFMAITYFDCTFNLTGVANLNNDNTTAFAIFKNQNSVWPVGVSGWGDITNNVISETHLGSVPMNLLIISVVDEQLYFAIKDFTPEDGEDYTLDLVETTQADLDALIESL